MMLFGKIIAKQLTIDMSFRNALFVKLWDIDEIIVEKFRKEIFPCFLFQFMSNLLDDKKIPRP